MSYARFSPTSDIYLYADVAGGLTCWSCALAEGGQTMRFLDEDAAVAHLRAHEAAGHHCGFHFDNGDNSGDNRGHWHYRPWDDLIAEVLSEGEDGAFTDQES